MNIKSTEQTSEPQMSSKLTGAIRFLQEKISRDFGINLEELKEKIITIKNGVISVK